MSLHRSKLMTEHPTPRPRVIVLFRCIWSCLLEGSSIILTCKLVCYDGSRTFSQPSSKALPSAKLHRVDLGSKIIIKTVTIVRAGHRLLHMTTLL